MANQNQKDEKKGRAPNFTVREKEILIDLVSAQKSIIENKKTDSIACEQKKQAWNKISQDFNTLSPAFFPRNVESFKKFYNNKKEELRKSLALEKRELYQTGGGLPPAPPPRDGADKLLASIINEKTLYGVPSSIAPFDDDYTCIDNDRENVNMEPNTQETEQETISWAKASMSQLTSHKHENLLTSVNKIQEPFENENNIDIIVMQSEADPEDSDIIETLKKEKTAVSQSQPLKIGINKQIEKEKKRKIDKTRRRPAGRPAPTVRTLSSSRLGELYEKLIEKKMELVGYLTKEHEARMNILELDKKIKEKQLAILEQESKSSSARKGTAIDSINYNHLSELESIEMG